MDTLLFRRIASKILVWLKRRKGSKKDPFLYLTIASVILFGVVSFVVPSFISNTSIFVFNQAPLANTNPFLVPGTSIQESPDLSLIQQNSLTAVSPPIMVTPQVLGALVGNTNYQWQQKEVSEYIVEPGDNLWSIAEKFDVSLNTILWANDLNKYTVIQIGQKLTILPITGVVHHVKNSDTLSQLAKIYKAKVDDIKAFNNLASEDDIYVGDILIVPEGIKPPPTIYAQNYVPIASSYFICPISPPCRITQSLHWYNAIDFSHGKCGEPIYAAAAGTVLKVKLTSSRSQWAFGGAGNHLTVLHPNGVVTMYGHIQASLVNPGDYVSQGQIIALMGGAPGTPGAGSSTGCHVHFGVSGAKNPFDI